MSLLNWLNNNLEKAVSAFLLGFIVILILVNVVMRYIFNASLSWGEELTLWCFVWFIWIAVSYGFQQGQQIRINVLRDRFDARGQIRMDMLVDILILFFFAVLIYECIVLIAQPFVMSQKSVVLGLPIALLYASAPVGSALSSFRIIQHFRMSLKDLRAIQSGKTS